MGAICSSQQNEGNSYLKTKFIDIITSQSISRNLSKICGPNQSIITIELHKKEQHKIGGKAKVKVEVLSMYEGKIRGQLSDLRMNLKYPDTFQAEVEQCLVQMIELNKKNPNCVIFIEQPQCSDGNANLQKVCQNVIKGVLLADLEIGNRSGRIGQNKKSKPESLGRQRTRVVINWRSIEQKKMKNILIKIRQEQKQFERPSTSR